MNYNYLDVYNKGEIQKLSKIPVPLLNRLERGERVNLSPSTKKRIKSALNKIHYSELKEDFPDTPPKELYNLARFNPERYHKARYSMEYLNLSPAEAREASGIQDFDKYQFLVKHGVRHDEAVFTVPGTSWDELKTMAEKNLFYAKRIAEGNGVPLNYILKGMAKSKDKTASDWEQYVAMRKRQKWEPIRQDGKGNYIYDENEKRNEEWVERMQDPNWRKDMGV